MIIGRRNRIGVVVEQTGHEGAHYQTGGLEGLMHRRGLMNSTGDRFEVANIKYPWIKTTVPTDDIERVLAVDVLLETTFQSDSDQLLPGQIAGSNEFGQPNVSFTKWR